MSERIKTLIIIFCLTLMGLLIYTFKLDVISSGFHGDEALLSLFSLKIIRGEVRNLIGVDGYNHPIFSFLPQALTMKIFGQNILGARLGPALMGIITIPLFYLFVKKIWDERTAIFATILLTASHWVIAINRLALNNNQTILVGILSFWAILKAFKTKNGLHFSIAGAIAALNIYLYAGARIILLIIFPLLIYQGIKEKYIWRYFKNIFLLVSCFIIIAAPQGIFFLKNMAAFSSRFQSIYIFSPGSGWWAKTAYPNENVLEIFTSQIQKTFNIFRGEDTSGQYGYKGRILDPIILISLIIGIVLALKNINQTKSLLLFLWFILPLIFGEIVMIDPFFFPRAAPAIPPLFIFAGLGIKFVWEKMQNLSPFKSKVFLVNILFLTLFMIYIYQNLYIYFIKSEQESFGDPNKYSATKIAKYFNQLEPQYQVIFLTAPNLYADFSTIKFIAPKVKPTNINNPFDFQSTKILKKTVFIVYPEYFEKLREIISLNPRGQLLEKYNPKGRIQFYIYKIDSI